MEYDVHVDHVRVTGQAAQLADCEGRVLIERGDHDLGKSQEAGESGLAAAAAPYLREHAGDNVYLVTAFDGPVKDPPEPAVPALDGDERTRVEGIALTLHFG